MENDVTTVLISQERLNYLLQLEASLPTKIEEAVINYKKNSLKRLHEIDKQNPDAINARVKRYVEKHRESINARRREKRRAKKQQDQVVIVKPNENSSDTNVLTPSINNEVNTISHVTTIITKHNPNRKQRAQKKGLVETVSYPPILKENVTVSFGL
jgi:hypothetical protein